MMNGKQEFLGRMIRTSFQYLKQGGKCIINIADIRLSRKKFIPIEQHTISLNPSKWI